MNNFYWVIETDQPMANAFALKPTKPVGFRHSRNYIFSISTTSKAMVEMVRK